MSFEKDMFQQIELVYSRYSGRMKELKDYIEMLTKKYNLEVEYNNSTREIAEGSINLIGDRYNVLI